MFGQIDAATIVTPTTYHHPIACEFLSRRIPILVEKPLALKKADAVRSTSACREAGVLLGLGTNKRFWPSMRELRRVVASGELGEILHVEGHYSNENSGAHFSEWRANPAEAPGGGMTGSGMLDKVAACKAFQALRRVPCRAWIL